LERLAVECIAATNQILLGRAALWFPHGILPG